MEAKGVPVSASAFTEGRRVTDRIKQIVAKAEPGMISAPGGSPETWGSACIRSRLRSSRAAALERRATHERQCRLKASALLSAAIDQSEQHAEITQKRSGRCYRRRRGDKRRDKCLIGRFRYAVAKLRVEQRRRHFAAELEKVVGDDD